MRSFGIRRNCFTYKAVVTKVMDQTQQHMGLQKKRNGNATSNNKVMKVLSAIIAPTTVRKGQEGVEKRFGGNAATKKTQRNLLNYDWSLESVEARLLVYKKNESVYEEDIKVLKRQIVNKCKTCLGYNVFSTPYTGNFMPPKPDLSFSGLEEFVNELIVSEPTVKKLVVETSEAKASADKAKVVRKNFGPPLIEDWISDSEDEAESMPKIEKKTIKPSFAKMKFVKSK
ncbi:hypothetical protein Tco_1126854 [Tanacetum coccineum]